MRGLGSRYRIYDAAPVDGIATSVFLAAPTARERAALAEALAPYGDLTASTTAGEELSLLTEIFAARPSADWETELLAKGVACVAVTTDSIESMMFDPAFGRASGYVTDVVHPILDEHPRLAPFVRFSRSLTQALPAVLCGQQTDVILAELGKDADAIADLRARKIVG
jgi:crotonobetainyl-CoA:carnitine CoA-transferase CaiB-like acyl-CoA transferase